MGKQLASTSRPRHRRQECIVGYCYTVCHVKKAFLTDRQIHTVWAVAMTMGGDALSCDRSLVKC